MSEHRANPPESIVEIHDVVFCRGARKIFDGLTLSIPRGKITAIMGPSGAGKTTLLNLITRPAIRKNARC